MAKIGSFIVEIGDIHLDWGIDRSPGRSRELGEGYVKIPISEAKKFDLYNKHFGNGIFKENEDEFGKNLFYGKFADGFKKDETVILKTSGNSGIGSPNFVYAKNLHGYNDLKLIKNWFNHTKANKSNKVKVTITAKNTIELEII